MLLEVVGCLAYPGSSGSAAQPSESCVQVTAGEVLVVAIFSCQRGSQDSKCERARRSQAHYFASQKERGRIKNSKLVQETNLEGRDRWCV